MEPSTIQQPLNDSPPIVAVASFSCERIPGSTCSSTFWLEHVLSDRRTESVPLLATLSWAMAGAANKAAAQTRANLMKSLRGLDRDIEWKAEVHAASRQ